MKALSFIPLPDDVLQTISRYYQIDQGEPDLASLPRPEDYSVLITNAKLGLGEGAAEKLSGLKYIASAGVGYDQLNLQQLASRGIKASYTPDVLTDCVADLAVGGMITLMRRINHADRFVRDGEWAGGKLFPRTTRVSHKTAGIVGLGRIGKAIARRLEAFGINIYYTGRSLQPDQPYRYFSSIKDLAEKSDILIIAASSSIDSQYIIDREVLSALGAESFLVNIARGDLIDESVLVEFLEAKKLAGAVLDVFLNEPTIDARFLSLDNTLLLPHIASKTVETGEAVMALLAENLISYAQTGRAVTMIPKL